jgi:hypothetical protein
MPFQSGMNLTGFNLTGRDTDTAFILRKEDNENIVPIWNAGILQDSHENFIGIISILKEKNAVIERKKENVVFQTRPHQGKILPRAISTSVEHEE